MANRKQDLIEEVFRRAPELELIFKKTEAASFHQEQLKGLADKDLRFVGAIVKVAGFYGVDIAFWTPTRKQLASGEKSKESR